MMDDLMYVNPTLMGGNLENENNDNKKYQNLHL